MEEKSENKVVEKEDVSLDDSFNMLVKLVRTNKLNYDEHMIVDQAVKAVYEALTDWKASQEIKGRKPSLKDLPPVKK